MNRTHVCPCLAFALFAIAVADSAASAAAPAPRPPSQQPAPTGRHIRARDGDLVMIERDARMTVVRRWEGNVRTVFDPARRWLLLLADYGGPRGDSPDGTVDWVYTFRDLSAEWPLGARWEGIAFVDEYFTIEGGSRALAISTPAGVWELVSPPADITLGDQTPAARVTYRGATRGKSTGLSFDQAEERHVKDLAAQTGDPGRISITTGSGPVAGVTLESGVVVRSPTADALRAPVRAGSLPQPAKLFDVRPVYPQKAREARITGTVLVEITIGTDGAVTDARVLRSIPLLDAAALEAVRQWRYDVTLVNGVPTPMRMVVTIPFP
jgi:TonB family protein